MKYAEATYGTGIKYGYGTERISNPIRTQFNEPNKYTTEFTETNTVSTNYTPEIKETTKFTKVPKVGTP